MLFLCYFYVIFMLFLYCLERELGIVINIFQNQIYFSKCLKKIILFKFLNIKKVNIITI